MPHRVFNLTEVAAYLHLTREDVEKLVRSHGIPVEAQAGKRFFRKKDIDAWASQRILGFSDKNLRAYHKTTSAKHHVISQTHAIVAELLQPCAIEPELHAKTKPSILRAMTALAEKTGLLYDPRDLLTSLEERESLCSTALPEGVALLHPRHHVPYMFSDSFLVLGRTLHPVPFGAPDGKETDLFFLMCCQDDRLHLHVLARLCLLCKTAGLLPALRQAEDAEAIAALLSRNEAIIIKTM